MKRKLHRTTWLSRGVSSIKTTLLPMHFLLLKTHANHLLQLFPDEETKDDILDVTGTTDYGYSVAVSLFSLAYATFEIPSNWVMKRFVRPSLWLGFLLFGWGALTLGFTGVQTYGEMRLSITPSERLLTGLNTGQIVGLRFLIGVFEAGFYPGIIYFITMWYPVHERSLRIALVGSSSSAAGAFSKIFVHLW